MVATVWREVPSITDRERLAGAVRREQLFSDGGGAGGDAAGGLVNTLATYALGEALSAVPAAQGLSGADAVGRAIMPS
jgi:hypothetical protein